MSLKCVVQRHCDNWHSKFGRVCHDLPSRCLSCAEVEGKHGRIHLAAAHRKISPAFASLAMRVPEWEARLAHTPHLLRDTMHAFQELKKRGRLAIQLGVQDHPQVIAAMSVLPNHTNNSHQVALATANVMYGNDPESKFDQMASARRCNKAAASRSAARRAQRIRFGVPTAPTWRNMVMKAQLEHFQLVHARGRVYSLPLELYGHLHGLRRGCAHVTPLQTKLLPHLQPGAAEQEQEAFLEQDDPLPPQPLLQPLSLSLLEDAEGDIERRVGSLVFFSVVDTKPSRARIIPIPPGAAARLGPDDIQVARHDLSGQQDGGQTGFISISSSSVTTNRLDVVSCLGHSVAKSPQKLLAWKVSRKITYVIDGMPLSNPNMMQVVTDMVVAKAFAGTGVEFTCWSRDALQVEALNVLESSGWVDCTRTSWLGNTISATHWCISALGMLQLVPCRVLDEPVSALADRDVAEPSKTAWELLLALEAAEWKWMWSARLGALPPIRVNTDGVERKVFTSNMRSKTRRQALRASYARCLLHAEELWALLGDDTAILEIGHYEKESYYKELLARLHNRGEQQLVAVNPCQACLIRQRMLIDSRSHVWAVGDRGGLRGWVESDLACVYLCFLQCAFLFF